MYYSSPQGIVQGFICPFCMADLGDFPRLQNHVNTVHPERKQDLTDTVIDNVKGFFDKAKRGMKILDAKMTAELSQYFNKVRDSSVNESAVRTNMLIIRLDRLINECPSDPLRRKEFEREVVPWSADSESLHCTRCAAKFGLARRRHHCRLCGRIMCHQCSQFLSFLSAKMLETDSTSTSDTVSSHSRRLLEMTQKTTEKVVSFIEGAVSKMQTTTDGSEVSLGSLLQQDAQECLRVCGSCMTDLSRREQMMEQRNPPVLAEQYETLDRMIADASAMVPSYTRMSKSINQRIAADAEKEHCGVKEAQLRRNIRLASVQALQVCSLFPSVTLPFSTVSSVLRLKNFRGNFQIEVLVNFRYLSQAATAGRLEEVEILERNLRYLEDEMFKMGLISPT
ncbi:unnamed protein product [Angiostrongylus costaricensis]|uniref:FYVE-type domain-containing protein n=1 Tax=Angiostrongylus costaricensis TaxID=334426 RepID=A0A158PHU0_ANGCS|nr:unnamed protein product [Angiostrongylus costaricensis]